MRYFFSNLIMPFPVFYILILIAVLLGLRKKRKLSRVFVWLSILWLLLISTPYLPNLLVSSLENQFNVHFKAIYNPSVESIHILVLGGGHTNDSRLPTNNQLTNAALSRLIEGIRIQTYIPGSTLITSGAGYNNCVPQAEVLAKTALMLGVDSARIKMQTSPKNTWMEATEYKRLFGDSARLILITCAVHMPRAVYLFRKAGLDPIAAPTNLSHST
jgi:uncharacterized SAM-binding protein YcdF (DUF218 family)